jgi:hypothetical protein
MELLESERSDMMTHIYLPFRKVTSLDILIKGDLTKCGLKSFKKLRISFQGIARDKRFGQKKTIVIFYSCWKWHKAFKQHGVNQG